MKILLTGSSGFVGKNLSSHLLDAGHTFMPYDLENGDDIRDRFKLDRLFESENFDAVISLAARAGVRRGEDFPEEYFSTNVMGVKNLVDLSEKYKVKKFIHFSSSSVFGKQFKDSPATEHSHQWARSVYGITKVAGELLIRRSALDYTIIRPFTIIGENGRKDMVIFKWINQIKSGKKASFYGDGQTFRGYTYVGEIIKGVLTSLHHPGATRQIFNLGGDQIVTLEELWQIFKEVFPNAEREMLPMPSSDQEYSHANTEHAFEKIGWKHDTNIKEKIKQIIEDEKLTA